MPYHLKSVLVLIPCILATGCVIQGITKKTDVEAVVETIVKDDIEAKAPALSQADLLLREGKYKLAAELFITQSDSMQSPLREMYRLRGADAFLKSGDTIRARSVAQRIDDSGLDLQTQFHKKIVLAEVELAIGAPSRVTTIHIPSSAIPEDPLLAKRFHLARARSFEKLERGMKAAKERVLAATYLSEEEQNANEHYLWENLKLPSMAELGVGQVDKNRTFAGWITLALIERKHRFDRRTLGQAVTAWSAQYPNHPATTRVLPTLLRQKLQEIANPKHIALLLPLTDRNFVNMSTLVREGFKSAWKNDTTNVERPKLSIEDTHAKGVVAAYRQARANGADLIVGPLDKNNVNILLSSGTVDVPILTLNMAGSSGMSETEASTINEPEIQISSNPNTMILFQFTLAPEGEAIAIAHRAWLDGHNKAAILVPQSDWGERTASAFSRKWIELGGKLVVKQHYDGQAILSEKSGTKESSTMKTADQIEAMLNVTQSKERRRKLESIIGTKLKFSPRRRTDIDFIFMIPFKPESDRNLKALMDFHQASKIPIYSTSQIYGGRPNRKNLDLQSVIFGDMPWVLSTDQKIRQTRINAESRWRKEKLYELTRLYAFGIDAYSIIKHLNTMRSSAEFEYEGVTGWLSLDNLGVISRKLLWARFDDGLPVLIDVEKRH